MAGNIEPLFDLYMQLDRSYKILTPSKYLHIIVMKYYPAPSYIYSSYCIILIGERVRNIMAMKYPPPLSYFHLILERWFKISLPQNVEPNLFSNSIAEGV